MHIENKAILQEPNLIELLTSNPEAALKEMYNKYYTYLCYAVYKVLPDRNIAEDLVQEVFFEVWKKRDNININLSLGSYLKRAAVNKTLNYIRDRKIKFEEEEAAPPIVDQEVRAQENMEANELQDRINEAIESLPEKCRIVFAMSRYEEMSYREISEKLGISIKTVENQISKALKILRERLSEYVQK